MSIRLALIASAVLFGTFDRNLTGVSAQQGTGGGQTAPGQQSAAFAQLPRAPWHIDTRWAPIKKTHPHSGK